MFTGLVVEMGIVESLKQKGGGAVLTLKAHSISQDAAVGDSIAINGTCLTVISINGGLLDFDLSHETLDSTNLGELKPGDRVNLEPSLRADGKLGGHFVTGHVDAVGRIRSIRKTGDMISIEIDAPADVTDYLVDKGSVAVDGISLTVVEVLKEGFTLVIIPHTAEITTIGLKGPGDTVNLEADIIGKYVARFLSRGRGGKGGDASLLGALSKSGFLGGAQGG